MESIDVPDGYGRLSLPVTMIEAVRWRPRPWWLFGQAGTAFVSITTVTGRVYILRFRDDEAAHASYLQVREAWKRARHHAAEEGY
jgi:hypothetical protein